MYRLPFKLPTGLPTQSEFTQLNVDVAITNGSPTFAAVVDNWISVTTAITNGSPTFAAVVDNWASLTVAITNGSPTFAADITQFVGQPFKVLSGTVTVPVFSGVIDPIPKLTVD